jgi:hypothetical protein
MDLQRVAAELCAQLRERPYWTTAAIVVVGWIVGRSLPLRAVAAMAGIGARAALAVALEDLVTHRSGPPLERADTR